MCLRIFQETLLIKIFSPRWWSGNLHWIWKNLVDEIAYCLKWAVSFLPGTIGRFCRRRYWGIGSVGRGVRIDEGCWFSHAENLTIGDHVMINKGCLLNAKGGLKIGNNTLLGPGVLIWTQNHMYVRRDIPIAKQGYEYKEVVIEDDVWIAARAIILPGVRIGKGSVIGAGAVVTRDVDSFSVVAGVPAMQIKERPNINWDASGKGVV